MAADVEDAGTKSYANFFQRRVVKSAQHWQTYVAEKQADPAALEQGQAQILRAISFSLTSPAAWPAARQLIESYASYMERRGYWDAWRDILTQAITAAQQHEDTAGHVTLIALRARLLQRQSRYREAVRAYRRVIRLARRTNNRFEEARACSNLGYLYIDTIGRWWRAEVLSCQALAIFEALDSDHGRAHTENHLGVLYIRRRWWAEAEIHLKQACALWQTTGDDHSLIYGFENLGMLYYETERPKEALLYLNKALYQAKLTNAVTEFGTIWNSIALVYRQDGNLKQAKAYAKQAETIFQRFSGTVGLAQVWGNLGMIYLYQHKWTKAKKFLQDSLTLFHSLSNLDGEIQALTDMIEFEFARGDKIQTSFRLNQLEELISKGSKGELQKYWKEQADKYRHRLTQLKV